MKSYIPFCLLLSTILNSMNAPKPLEYKPLTMNHWEFFSETNDLDRMGPALPFWDSKKDLPIESIAYLHILEQSNFSKKKLILNTECDKGGISYFLATKADHVIINTQDMDEMIDMITKFKHSKLTFYRYFDIYKYDLIVSCHPIAEKPLLAQLTALLNPHGEIFCLFNTQSNKKPVLLQAFENMNPSLQKKLLSMDYQCLCALVKKMFSRPTDNLLKEMIANSKLKILTYEQKNSDIFIMKNERDNFLATCRAIFMKLPILKSPTWAQKKNTLANQFIGNIVKIIKTNDSGNWIYPFDFTVVHVKKSDI